MSEIKRNTKQKKTTTLLFTRFTARATMSLDYVANYERLLEFHNWLKSFASERTVSLKVADSKCNGFLWTSELIVASERVVGSGPVLVDGEKCEILWNDGNIVGLKPPPSHQKTLEIQNPPLFLQLPECFQPLELCIKVKEGFWSIYGDVIEVPSSIHQECCVFLPVFKDESELVGMPVFTRKYQLFGFIYDTPKDNTGDFKCALPNHPSFQIQNVQQTK